MNINNVINYEGLENIVINIVLELINNQDLLKCLYYNSSDALTQTNLTDEIIYQMIDQEDLTNTKIYITPFPSNIIDEAKSELRVYIRNFSPGNIRLSRIIFDFAIIVHNNLWVLDGGKQRPLVIIQEILNSLNGKSVSGLGKLNLMDNTSIIKFSDNFSGYILPLQTWSD